jgi:glycosyltransferase involved in cell wall biosynthesis
MTVFSGSQQNTAVDIESPRETATTRAAICVSVVMPTLNEAAQVSAAVAALRWADEVIVVDGGSTDDTATLARAAGARVLVLEHDTIAAQRNAGIAAARNHWILALDADERVTPELQAALAALPTSFESAHSAYRVRSRNWHLGRELRHGPWGRDWKVRVFTSDRRFANVRVHENLESLDDVGTLDGALLHYPYRDLAHHVAKAAKYARWAAADLHDRGRRARLSDVMVRPAWRFVRDYVLFGGWRDGAPGLVVTTVSAFSVFLKYACLWMMIDP